MRRDDEAVSVSEFAALQERVKVLERMLRTLAEERHAAAVESGGFMRGHNIAFEACDERMCAAARGE